MFAPYTFGFLFFMSSTHSLEFNSFRRITQEITSYMARTQTKTHQTCWLKQKLDHFNENEKRTWKMRYFRRHDLWKQSGPIYVFLGGEAEGSPSFLYSGVAYDLAKETKGILFATEHRFYGKSTPVEAATVKDLKFLNVRQALADNAHLIRIVKRKRKFRKSKVVVIGCSYSGNLAVWMRLMYPDLVDAAIASSAPVLAKKDFYEYLEKVSDNIKQHGTEVCWSAINYRFKDYENMFTTEEGIEKLKEDENICSDNDMSLPENRQMFFSAKISPFMGVAQYGNTTQIKDQCRTFNTKKISLQYHEFDLWAKQRQCNNLDFNAMINYYYKNKMNDDVGWLYQTCTEFGYFQSTSSDNQPFTHNVPVDFDVEMCTRVYGSEFNESRIDSGIDNVNKKFGGLKPQVTNVVFVNGDLDPWSRLGVLKGFSENTPAIIIPRASHCRDIFSNSEDDEKELKVARSNIKNYIKKWIGFRK